MQTSSPGELSTSPSSRKRVYTDPQELITLIQKLPDLPLHCAATDIPPCSKRIKLDKECHHQRRSAGCMSCATVIHNTVRTDPVELALPTPTPLPLIPAVPHLYHLAVSAHRDASRHLQQIFIPSTIAHPTVDSFEPIVTIRNGQSLTYQPDPLARDKALGLLLLSLDLLRVGFAAKEISEVDKVHFGIEFALVTVEVLRAHKMAPAGKGKAVDKVDVARIRSDARDAVANGLSVSRRLRYLAQYSRQLELLDAQLLYLENKPKAARRAARQALASSDSPSHSYALILLQLEYADPAQPGEILTLVEQLETFARARKHVDMVRLACLIRVRVSFEFRRWVDLPLAIQTLKDEVDTIVEDETEPELYAWHANLKLHYTLFRVLWDGRSGDDVSAKRGLKETYALMDRMTDDQNLAILRRNGGVLRIPAGDAQIMLQTTPINICFLMTYLVTVVSRRDYLGADSASKCLVLPRLLRETDHLIKAEDMWDLDFAATSDIRDVCEMRRKVMSMRVEVMMEEATALMYRNQGVMAEKLLESALQLAKTSDVFAPLAPHFCFIHAQFAHLLGRDQAAMRSYRACSALLVHGSEMGLIVEMCVLACQGGFMGLLGDRARAERVRSLVERCKSSSNAALSASGQFMGSLIEANRIASKKKLSNAYSQTRKANNNVLRCLIFAFTTSSHLYGAIDALLDQLETGRHMASLMGGKDRSDGVGQLVLGLWFTEKLKEHYRREGHVEKHAAAKASQRQHVERLNQQQREVTSIPCNEAI